MKFKKNINYNARKIHRYLGVFLGIQFLFWTLGGLYFSWNNMDDVHGKTLLKQDKIYFKNIDFSQIQKGIDSLKILVNFDSIQSINLVEAFGKPFAQLKYFDGNQLKVQLIVAETGKLRPLFSGQECIELVEGHLKNHIPIIKAEFLDKHTVGNHHEYREKPLPAYAFTLDHPSQTTIYISTESGQITSVRNNNWRRFDFLWMLHTMDYTTRDIITNWVLRIFSALGVLTIFSGFFLFYLTSPTIRKLKK
ncbi:hypothetical protein BX611_0685 [Lutibacter oceani]|uniref:PepSY-associated transmembrane protein n=1 Tax=Lutibacter oceani TaxID=1853311 RepID=A0A3D9S261_9FLAO|nr:hypothetical protein [Lutibacter oceani]REE83396.1 hypothetical protein BX611_0685 [Lutibacter oceani]